MSEFQNKLPPNWIVSSLGDICSQPQYGYTTKASDNGTLRLLRTTDITSGCICWDSVPFCLENPADEEKYLLGDGDIVISRAGSVGVSYLLKNPEHSVFASYLIRFKPYINTQYFKYFLDSPYYWKEIADNKLGIAVPNVNASKLTEIPIPLPPENEQHRIVAKIEELFSELDKGIENLKTAQVQLKVYRQALLKHAFEGKLTAQWREQNRDQLETAAALLQRIQQERAQRYQQQLADWEKSKSPSVPLLQRGKTTRAAASVPHFDKGGLGGISGNTAGLSKPKAPKPLPPLTAEELAELPELPEGWVYTRVGALIDDPAYGTSKKCDYEVDGLGVLRIPNVISGKVDATDLKFAQFTPDEIATYKLGVGDILIIRSNGSVSIVGRCALVSEADVDYLYAGYLIRLRPHRRLVEPGFLLNTFSLHATRKQIEQKAKSTSGVNNINTGEIQSLVVALCGIEEQKQIQMEIEARLSEVDQLELTLATSLQQAEALHQSILKRAFSGQLVPQDPHDEPASALLARIRAEREQSDVPKRGRKAV